MVKTKDDAIAALHAKIKVIEVASINTQKEDTRTIAQLRKAVEEQKYIRKVELKQEQDLRLKSFPQIKMTDVKGYTMDIPNGVALVTLKTDKIETVPLDIFYRILNESKVPYGSRG